MRFGLQKGVSRRWGFKNKQELAARLFSHSHGNGHRWNQSRLRDHSQGSSNVCGVASLSIPLCWCHYCCFKFSRAVNTANSNTGNTMQTSPCILSLTPRLFAGAPSEHVPWNCRCTLGNVHPHQQRHTLRCPYAHTNRNTSENVCLSTLTHTYTEKFLLL